MASEYLKKKNCKKTKETKIKTTVWQSQQFKPELLCPAPPSTYYTPSRHSVMAPTPGSALTSWCWASLLCYVRRSGVGPGKQQVLKFPGNSQCAPCSGWRNFLKPGSGGSGTMRLCSEAVIYVDSKRFGMKFWSKQLLLCFFSGGCLWRSSQRNWTVRN